MKRMKSMALAMALAMASTSAVNAEEGKTTDYVALQLWQEEDFWNYREHLLAWLSEESGDREAEAAKARDIARIAGALYEMNVADPKDIIESPDPVLASSMFVWGAQLSVDISRILDARPSLNEAFQVELQGIDPHEEDASPLGLSPKTGFERAMSEIVARRTWSHEGNQSEEPVDSWASWASSASSEAGRSIETLETTAFVVKWLESEPTDDPTGGDSGGTEVDGSNDGTDGTDGTDGSDGSDGGEELPCGDTCDQNSGEVPDETGDSTDGTTQPGDDEETPALDISERTSNDPLILISPDQAANIPIAILVRGPAYGLTQPGPFTDEFFVQGGEKVLWGVTEMLARGHEAASSLESHCRTEACRRR